MEHELKTYPIELTNVEPVLTAAWEICGHWDPRWDADPSQIPTDVFHLLRQR